MPLFFGHRKERAFGYLKILATDNHKTIGCGERPRKSRKTLRWVRANERGVAYVEDIKFAKLAPHLVYSGKKNRNESKTARYFTMNWGSHCTRCAFDTPYKCSRRTRYRQEQTQSDHQ